MNTYHAALWSPHYDDRDRITNQQWTKQRGNGQQRQRTQDSWTWEEILDGEGPWAQPGEYCHPKAEREAVKAERRRYEEAARRRGWKPESQPQKCIGGSTRGVWRSQVGDLRQLPVLSGEREGPGRHHVMLWSARCPRCGCIARCSTFQLLVSAGLEWAWSQVP